MHVSASLNTKKKVMNDTCLFIYTHINSIADKILKHNIFLLLLIPEKEKNEKKKKKTEKNSSGVSHSEKNP